MGKTSRKPKLRRARMWRHEDEAGEDFEEAEAPKGRM